MTNASIFVLFLAITIHEAQSQCNGEMCNVICTELDSGPGFCDGNECDCSTSKKCSEWACDKICDQIKLQGKCDDNGMCTCTAKLVPCMAWDCVKQCLEDPRTAQCEAQGGFVTPIACMKYGWIRTCGCLCTLPGTSSRVITVHENKFNYFLPAYKSTKLFRNYHILTNNV